MSEATVERLQAADSSLTRSFAWWLAVLVGTFGYTAFVAPLLREQPGLAALGALALLALRVAVYVWYAVSAGAAASLLGATRWHYVAWILVAPFLALVPIPIVSLVIAVSPLSIKFLLGGQLQTAIREATFGQLHGA
jgi:hypothetical protein